MEQFGFIRKVMALVTKGKVITGNEAAKKLVEEKTSKEKLTPEEVDFILTKLRRADYKGVEFEMFYIVFNKLTELKK